MNGKKQVENDQSMDNTVVKEELFRIFPSIYSLLDMTVKTSTSGGKDLFISSVEA